jgi:amino acid transporter
MAPYLPYTSLAVLISLSLGLMLSPENLITLGTTVGSSGPLFLLFITSSVVIFLFAALSYGKAYSLFRGPASEVRLIQETLGTLPATVLPLCSRLVVVIYMGTALLATAGYVFNELFVRWFPNLGFSFCLLALLLMINLWNQRISEIFQIILISIAVLGLLLLSIAGFAGFLNSTHTFTTTNHLSFSSARVAFVGLMLFIGLDLSGLAKQSNDIQPLHRVFSMTIAVVVAGLIFILWGFVSLQYVSPERLSDTTVPHLITARMVWGTTGRLIMGLVILAGAFSAVNVLLLGVSKLINSMAQQGLLPSFLAGENDRGIIPLTLLAVVIGVMLVSGMAGSSLLDVYVRAGLLLWLLNYAAVHLAVLISSKYSHSRTTTFYIPGYPVVTFISFIVMFCGFFVLLYYDNQSALLFKYTVVILCTTTLLSFFWITLKQGRI